MSPRRVELTEDYVRDLALVPAKGGRIYIYDSTERGLHLAVTQTGIKSFWWQGRVDGRPDRIALGRWPETSVKKAKSRAVLVRAAIEEGRDPRAALAVSRRRRGAITIAEFFEIYLDRQPETFDRETTRRMFGHYCAALQDRPLVGLRPDEVRRWHAELGDRSGPSAANKAASILTTLYNRAMDWDDPSGGKYATSNPATAKVVPRFKEDERDRFMSLDELRQFWSAIGEHETRACRDFFRLAICTAQRKSTVKQMRWADIDTENWIWVVPRLKGGRKNHPVPLCKMARDILEFRQQLVRGEWVFPGRRRNKKPIGNVYFWWDELRTAAEIQDVTIHDLRRTLASWMAMTGAPYQVIAQLLGHRLPGPTAIYARLDVEPVRAAVETALKAMGAYGQREQRKPDHP